MIDEKYTIRKQIHHKEFVFKFDQFGDDKEIGVWILSSPDIPDLEIRHPSFFFLLEKAEKDYSSTDIQ